MPWEKNWGATDGNGKLRIKFPPTAYYMMQVGGRAGGERSEWLWVAGSDGVAAVVLGSHSVGSACSCDRRWLAELVTALPLKPPLKNYPLLPLLPCLQRDLQTKRQIEKAVDILRRNGVYADYVYVRGGVAGRALELGAHYSNNKRSDVAGLRLGAASAARPAQQGSAMAGRCTHTTIRFALTQLHGPPRPLAPPLNRRCPPPPSTPQSSSAAPSTSPASSRRSSWRASR